MFYLSDEEPRDVQGNSTSSRAVAAQKAAQRARGMAQFDEQSPAWEARRFQEEAEHQRAPKSPKSQEAKWNIPYSNHWQRLFEARVALAQQHAASPELISIVDCKGRDLCFIWNDSSMLELIDVPEADIFPLVITSQACDDVAAKLTKYLAFEDVSPVHESKRNEEEPQQEQTKCENRRDIDTRAQREDQEAENKGKIDAFLGAHGFAGVNKKRMGKFGRFKYPLHTAVKREPEILPVLLAAGADPSRKNSAGLTPLQYAQKLSSFEAERLLCDRPTFHRGVKHGSG